LFISIPKGQNMNLLRKSVCLAAISAVVATLLLGTTPVQAQTEDIQKAVTDQLLLTRLLDPGDEIFGATMQPIGEALRAQLDVPAGQGLLVASMRADGPSAAAGLKQNDVLLSLGDRPLAAPEDLVKFLKAAGEAPVALKILRAGKAVTIQVRPVYRVTIGAVEVQKTEYFIGVTVETVDDVMRNHLGLPADRGLLITEVVAGSPAEKTGVKKHDVIVELTDKPMDSFDTLAKQVQANQDKPTTLKLLRAGKPLSIAITGAIRKVEAETPDMALRAWMTEQQRIGSFYRIMDGARRQGVAPYNVGAPAMEDDIRQRLDSVEKDLKTLQRIEALEKELKAVHDSLEKLSESIKPKK
jgi:membrane-associated protease RseP (regulator of RpoE activity)